MTGETSVPQNGAKLTRIMNVHVVVADAACLYFDYLIRNFRHTAKDPSRLFFFCYSLDQQAQATFVNDPRLSGCYPVYEMRGAYRLKTLHEWKVYLGAKLSGRAQLGGSNGHAAGLNRIMKALPTMAGHHVIADSDVAMLVRDWDEVIEDNFSNYHLIGTSYEDVGGFSSGNSKVQTYKKFPNANWLAIRSDCDLSALDWFPMKERNLKIDTEAKAELYNLPLGYEMVCDGGWRFPGYCRDQAYRAKAMRQVKPTSTDAQIVRTSKDYNEEYQLDGRAFVGHQRGGSRHVFRDSEVSMAFYDCVERAVGVPD